MTWPVALLLTLLIEFPIWWVGSRDSPRAARWLVGLGGTLLTHPVVWFVFPWHSAPYGVVLVAAELFAWGAEAALAHGLAVRRPWLLSAYANGASFLTGSLIHWWMT